MGKKQSRSARVLTPIEATQSHMYATISSNPPIFAEILERDSRGYFCACAHAGLGEGI